MKLYFKKHLKSILITGVTLMVIIAGSFWLFSKNPEEVKAGWWNESWMYRQAITVTNNGGAQDNVYIAITLNTDTASTSMKANCGDFRFTTQNGGLLDYYIVSGCRTASNVIHVNFDVFPIGAQTIYFYYGNPSAEDGFSSAGFTTEASSYTIGAAGAVETGPGPVGWWSFDEGYGSTAHDSSGQGNHGTITGASWQDESMCVAGKCLWFNGVSDLVTVPNSKSLEISTAITLQAWVRLSSPPSEKANDMGVIFKQASYALEMEADTDCTDFHIISNTGLNELSTINCNMDTRQWNLLSSVFDGSTLRVYQNGFQIGQMSVSKRTIDKSINDLIIGYSQWSGNQRYFNGFIDEVKIYPYARTADQIKADYAAGLAGVGTSQGVSAAFGGKSDFWMTDGLVGYWKFDESATTSGAIDSSGNGNDGTYYEDASTTAGKFGNGGSFDGTGDYVRVGNLNVYNFEDNESFSISTWFKTGNTGLRRIVSKGHNGWTVPGYMLQLYSSPASIGAGLSGTGGQSQGTYVYTSAAVNDNKWHHAVAVFNQKKKTLEIFIDGVRKNLTKHGTTCGTIIDNQILDYGACAVSAKGSSALDIGGYGSLESFDGQIDEVRIYNRALSAHEVRKLYEWAPGPVAHWKFDELMGDTAYDTSGYGNHGLLGGGVAANMPEWRRGKYGGALKFDGSNDVVVVPHNPSLDITSDMISVSAWIKPLATGQSSGSYIVTKSDGGSAAIYGIKFRNTNKIEIAIRTGGIEYEYIGNTVLTIGEWYHVTEIYDGANLSLYINGVLDNSWSLSGNIDSLDTELSHGAHADSPSERRFNGMIDDVRIYNYARTQKQILEDMHGGKPGPHPILHLSFDEGYGGTAHDKSGYGNHGTLNAGGSGGNPTVSSMWTKDGKFGGAMSFDGTNDYVDFGNVGIIDGVSEATVCAWYFHNAASVTVDGVLVSKYQSGSDGWLLWVDDVAVYSGRTDTIAFAPDAPGGTGGRVEGSTGLVTPYTWDYYCGVFKGGEYIRLYKNAILDQENTTNIVSVVDSSSYPLRLGNIYSNSRNLIGYLDEVKIFNYALSEEEIRREYASGGKSAVMGAVSTATTTSPTGETIHVPSFAASAEYCVPGSTDYCAPPVGEWKFDEMTGNTAYDTSGNGNDGVLGGGTPAYRPTWTPPGKIGSALSFDGVDDYINAGSDASLDDIQNQGKGGMTVSAWINPNSDSITRSQIVNKDGNYANAWTFNLFYGTTLEFMKYGGTDLFVRANAYSISLNNWQHVLMTWDGSTNASNVNFYVNGIETGYSIQQNGVSFDSDSSLNLLIGNRTGLNQPYSGLMDQVRIYNYIRTPAQIAWEYNKGKPIAHWRFDECQGPTIHDDSGNGNHGTINLGASGVTQLGTCASSSNSFWYNGRTGKVNSAGSFDGEDDYVGFSAPNSLDDSVTVSAWVKPENLTQNGIIVSIDSTNHKGAFGIYGDQNKILLDMPGNGKGLIGISDYLSTQNWQHWLLVYSSGSLNKFYLDGIEKTLVNVSDRYDVIGNQIGSRAAGTQRLFNGLIDEVKIWNYALTPEQVKMEYSGGAVRFE